MSYVGSRVAGDESFLREVGALRRSLWLQGLALAAWRGLIIGAIAVVVGEVFVRVARLSLEAGSATAVFPLVSVVVSIAWSVTRRPSLMQAARAADRRLHLREQLATALELLDAPEQPFAMAQVARAGAAVRQARRQLPEPRSRWVIVAAACVCASIAIGVLATWTRDWLPSSSTDESTSLPLSAADVGQPNAADSQALGSLQQLMQPVDSDDPPSQEQLASTEQALANKTAESRAAQQALSSLANALQQVSAGQAAADALNSGDYQTATADINQLAQQSDQLSADARKALSNALSSAARATPDSPVLADREGRAADALKYSSYAPNLQSLKNLADAVNKTSQSVLSQDQLSAAWQQLQAAQLRAQKGDGLPPNGPQALAPLSGDASKSQVSSGGPSGQTDQAAPGSGNTSSAFEPDTAPSRLNAVGVPVEVPLQISAGPGRQAQAPDSQQTGTMQVVSDPARVSNEGAANTQVQAAQAERNAVPQDLRSTVRGYFAAGTPSQ